MTAITAIRPVRIFLLDDTRELRSRVRSALSADDGLEVVGEADDPVEGLPLIEDLQPDVVICDLEMPRMNGLEALPRIAKCAPDAAVVIFSSFLGEALGATALGRGADRYVEKRVPLEELAQTVHEVAAARRAGERPVATPVPAPVPAPRVPAAAAPDDGLEDVVAEVGRLGTLRLALLTTVAFALATGLSLVTGVVPTTFLVLWLMPVLALGALAPAPVTAAAITVGVGLYSFCAYDAGAPTWYGAGVGVALCMATLAYAASRMTGWVRRRVQEEHALTRDLRRSNAELEHFAYIASHDLSAPLRTVNSFAEMLQKRYGGQLDGEADKMIGFITGGTRRMQLMIDDLLAFARAGRVDSERRPFELSRVVAEVQADLAAQIAERDAHITASQLPRLVGDQSQIAQLMLNLISNAIKFCPPERVPEITVSAQRLPAGWRVDVSDNGIGIDPRHASQVFGMFQRLHGDDTFPGTGIGLAICQRIVERHGGRIWVDGFEGEGSTFSFTLPDAG